MSLAWVLATRSLRKVAQTSMVRTMRPVLMVEQGTMRPCVSMGNELARSERFELPTLGFEVRCSIQLSYERVRGVDYQTWPDRASSLLPGRPGRRAGLWRRRDRSEAGMSAAVLAEIGRRTLPAAVVEGAVWRTCRAAVRAYIMAEADRVERSIGVKGGPRLRQAGCGGQRGQDCSGRGRSFRRVISKSPAIEL